MTTGKNILLVSFDNCMPFQKQSAAFGVRLQTPNLDRIMARAAVFRAAHCEIPLCGPSRASFMTGRMPHDIGLLSNEGHVFDLINAQDIWTCRLKEARYFCSSGGGVCHGRKPFKWRHSTHDIDGEDVALPDILAAMVRQAEHHKDQFIWGPVASTTIYRIPDRFAEVL